MKLEPPTFLIIDPHPVILHGIESILNHAWPDSAVHTAADFGSALQEVKSKHPCLIICEFRIGNLSVLEFLQFLISHTPAARCLVFSASDESLAGNPSIRAGASGYLRKSAPVSEFLASCQTILSGHRCLSHQLVETLAAAPSPVSSLSRREQEIFTYLGSGQTVSQIATRLGLSIKTIEAHREHIKAKLNLQNAAQVTAAASKWINA